MKKRIIVLWIVLAVLMLVQNDLMAQKPSLILPLKLDQTYRITVGYGGICDNGVVCDNYHTDQNDRYAIDFGHPTYNSNPEIVAVANGNVIESTFILHLAITLLLNIQENIHLLMDI